MREHSGTGTCRVSGVVPIFTFTSIISIILTEPLTSQQPFQPPLLSSFQRLKLRLEVRDGTRLFEELTPDRDQAKPNCASDTPKNSKGADEPLEVNEAVHAKRDSEGNDIAKCSNHDKKGADNS